MNVEDESLQDAVIRGLARQVRDALAVGPVREGPADATAMSDLVEIFRRGHRDADPAERFVKAADAIGVEGVLSPEDAALLASAGRRIVAADPVGWAEHFRLVVLQYEAYGFESEPTPPEALAIMVAAKIGKAEFEGGPLPADLDIAEGGDRFQAGIRAARQAQQDARPEGTPIPGYRHSPENMREVAHLSRRYALLIEGAGEESVDLKAWSARGLLHGRVIGSVLEQDVEEILPPEGMSAAVSGAEAVAKARRIAVRADAIADAREREGKMPLAQQAAAITKSGAAGLRSKGPAVDRQAEILPFPAMDRGRLER